MPHLFWLTKRKCPRWVDCKPIGVYWSMPSLMNPSRTSVMFRLIKECFDFWDVWVRAGPTSNLVWLQYQTIPHNYSKVLDLRALFFCHNQDTIKIISSFERYNLKNNRLHTQSVSQWSFQRHFHGVTVSWTDKFLISHFTAHRHPRFLWLCIVEL